MIKITKKLENKKDVNAEIDKIKKEEWNPTMLPKAANSSRMFLLMQGTRTPKSVLQVGPPPSYAVITKDRVSDYSISNGFAKFKTKESPELCSDVLIAF